MGCYRGKLIAIFASALLALASVVSAQSTRPSVPEGKYENEPISSGAVTSSPSATTQPSLSLSATGQLDMSRVALALGLVLAMIFGMVWVGRRFFPSAGIPRSAGAMKVLSRLVISPKQQILMIQVGRRIVVAADSGGQMSPLSEITDPDEAASLLGQVAEEKSHVSMKAFGSLFHRAEERFEEELIESPPDREGSPADSPNIEDPAIESARGEIDELADKVRLLSAQFGK